MDWVVALLLGAVIGGGGIFFYLKITSQKSLLAAQSSAKRILEEAESEAEALKREKLLEAEEEIFEQKQSLEEEIENERSTQQDVANELDNREIEIDRKAEIVAKKEEEVTALEKQLEQKDKYVKQKTDELNGLIHEQIRKLEDLSGLSREEAKKILLADLEEDAREEGVRISQSIIEQARLESGRKAREIVIQAIQQIAAEQSVEATVSIITLPNDDMKGRIIGREGRNIRSFELTTGVDVIIDDTPEIVVLSSYNSYRREIARRAMDKLISDGRIHPARIEEVVEKTGEEIKEDLRELGEQALIDVGVHGVSSELTELVGKLKYRTSYGQNVLKHSLEVAHLCGIMAAELGLDVRLAKRAGILHDIGKALDSHGDGDHAHMGAELLRKQGENPVVVNAAEAHHNERDASSPITILVAAADNISGNRPGARRESLENFIKRMEHLEKIAHEFDGVKKTFAIQAGREVRVMVETENIDDNKSRELAREIAREIQKGVEFPGQIRVTVIREYRAYDYAT